MHGGGILSRAAADPNPLSFLPKRLDVAVRLDPKATEDVSLAFDMMSRRRCEFELCEALVSVDSSQCSSGTGTSA